MVIIKGHRHLQECAYIGDDSSEEEDELEEIAAEKEALLVSILLIAGKIVPSVTGSDLLLDFRRDTPWHQRTA